MIPADVLSLAAAGGVTLSVSATGAGYDATATYAFAGGGLPLVARDEASPRDAVASVLAGLSKRCRVHMATCEARGAADAARTWRGRYRLLRDLRLDALALWPVAAEVAS